VQETNDDDYQKWDGDLRHYLEAGIDNLAIWKADT
jgi:hypothetical protein